MVAEVVTARISHFPERPANLGADILSVSLSAPGKEDIELN